MRAPWNDLESFEEYCWEFYGPGKMYGDFFQHSLTRRELSLAVALRAASKHFAGDSVDRETVRDILLTYRKGA